MPLDSQIAVQTTDLGRRFGPRWALARVDLEVPEGQRLLVFGENGGGKTTLLKVLSTAYGPSRGSFRIFGLDPRERLQEVRHHLGLLTHLPSLYEDLSARENLEVVTRLRGHREDVRPWLTRVGLEDRPDPVRAYSAGMRKRLSFARLLLQRPRLALVDEPYGQLDPEGMAFVDRLIRELPAEGITLVMASHQVDRVSSLCDRAILLHRGLPRWEGPAAEAPRAWRLLHAAPLPQEPGVVVP